MDPDKGQCGELTMEARNMQQQEGSARITGAEFLTQLKGMASQPEPWQKDRIDGLKEQLRMMVVVQFLTLSFAMVAAASAILPYNQAGGIIVACSAAFAFILSMTLSSRRKQENRVWSQLRSREQVAKEDPGRELGAYP